MHLFSLIALTYRKCKVNGNNKVIIIDNTNLTYAGTTVLR